MKNIVLIVVAALAAVGGRAEAGSRSSRCIDVRPICPPGQHPICLCESDYSYNCAWVCAGR